MSLSVCVTVISVRYAKSLYTEFRYAECHYAECYYADCFGAMKALLYLVGFPKFHRRKTYYLKYDTEHTASPLLTLC